MAYHHLALAVKDIKATHAFYEGVMGFELVKVEVAPVAEGGWGQHYFYRMDGDDSRFIAFWQLHDTPDQDSQIYDLNKAAGLPQGTNHFSFAVQTLDELHARRTAWQAAGFAVFEIDHNWCHSIYTRDPDGNAVEFCLTTGDFTGVDRERALAAMDEQVLNPTPAPAHMKLWPAEAGEA